MENKYKKNGEIRMKSGRKKLKNKKVTVSVVMSPFLRDIIRLEAEDKSVTFSSIVENLLLEKYKI